jgi:hypothetical protein
MITIDSRRKSSGTLGRLYPAAKILDVTSRGDEPWVRFSPFYPHGGIPVPFSPTATASSVEGIWQALKVFESADVDLSRLSVTTMSGLKRTVRRNGRVLGHRAGLDGDRLLAYGEARRTIYLPTYRWVLENRLVDEVERLKELAHDGDVVLLDYETNGDVNDLSRPLSHASLVAAYVCGNWPDGDGTAT